MITYPRELLTGFHWGSSRFNINWGTFGNADPLINGDIPTLGFGAPAWEATFRTAPVERDQVLRLKAWFNTLRGANKTFYGYDPGRQHPAAHFNGSNGWGAFSGNMTVTALAANTISVSGGFAGLQLSEGDMIGLSEGTRRHLHIVTEDVTLAGGIGDVSVEPYVITTLFTTAATAHVFRPVAEFVVDKKSWAGDTVPDLAPVSWKAVQKVPYA